MAAATPPTLLRTALILGLMSCTGPFAIDMYLPALPRLGAELDASVAATQATITAYFLAFGVAQLVYGPWSDQAGRRFPLYFGLTIFIVGALICSAAPTIGWLTAGRFVQGLGGAAVMVIPRAIVRDMHTGPAATRMMASIMLVISISPMLAPLTGSALIAFASWRAIFLTLCLAAMVSLALLTFALPETRPPEMRVKVDARDMVRTALRLLSDPYFCGLTLIGGFGMASFFVFIASASFVYTESFGLSPTQFSLAFAVNAIGFFAASQTAASLGMRFGAPKVVMRAVTGFAICDLVLLALALAGAATLPVVMVMLFLGNACLGLVIPTAMVMALDANGRVAGLASSLGGTLQMLVGGAMIAASGPFFDGTVVPMVTAIAICAVMAFLLASFALKRAPSPV